MDIDFDVEQTDRGRRYFRTMPNGEDARLKVVQVSPTHWIAASTFVPVAYRGGGIAEALVARLFRDARAAGAKITPSCWYVADELRRVSPQWDDVWMR